MAPNVTRDELVELLSDVSDDMIEAKDTLAQLDADLGDGDLGRTIERGFKAMREALDSEDETDFGKLLYKQGKTFANAAPSSFGSLFSTALMKGGMALRGQEEAALADIADAAQEALDALMERGKAELGDKTLLDALHPAIVAMRKALEAEGDSLSKAAFFRAAADAAAEGADKTKDMQSQIGRASWQGERSIGKVDPGARAFALMFEAAARHFET